MRKNIATKIVVITTALILTMTGCGSGAGNYASSPAESDPAGSASYSESSYKSVAAESDIDSGDEYTAEDREYTAGQEEGTESGSALRQAQKGEKIVYSADITIETLGYDNAKKSISEKITGAGGFVESENESDSNSKWYDNDSGASNRSLYITARVPSEKFDEFTKSLEGDGKITSRSVSAQNITQTYSDTEAVKKALEIEQSRLLSMMDKAETIEDMIAIEKRLSEVEQELNYYKTSLSGMDRDVEFSTVYIRLQEVRKYSPVVKEVPFITRLGEAFSDAVENFVIFIEELILFLVRNILFIILMGVIVAIVLSADKKRKRKLIDAATAVSIPKEVLGTDNPEKEESQGVAEKSTQVTTKDI